MASPKTIHCAAVDLGATSGRVIVGTWNGRRLALTEVHRFAKRALTVLPSCSSPPSWIGLLMGFEDPPEEV